MRKCEKKWNNFHTLFSFQTIHRTYHPSNRHSSRTRRLIFYLKRSNGLIYYFLVDFILFVKYIKSTQKTVERNSRSVPWFAIRKWELQSVWLLFNFKSEDSRNLRKSTANAWQWSKASIEESPPELHWRHFEPVFWRSNQFWEVSNGHTCIAPQSLTNIMFPSVRLIHHLFEKGLIHFET